MSMLTTGEVPEPNLLDPSELDAIDTPIPDFYVVFYHPKRTEEECHIPCRELDPGEALVFQLAVRDKYPDMPEGPISDLSDAERQEFWEKQKTVDQLDNELFTEIAVCAFLQDGWTRERVAKLPKSTRRAAYEGATAGINAKPPAVDTFSQASGEGVSDDAEDVPRGDADESQRGTESSEKPVSERKQPTSDTADQ